jgi:hypothetical protein
MLDLEQIEETEILLAHKPEHSSRTHPDLPNKPGGPDNWVEKAGGLPSYIKRIAKHIYYDGSLHPRTVSHAIAAAVERVKVLAAKGNAQAVAALAQWEAKRGKAHALEEETGEVIDLGILKQTRRTVYSTYGNSVSGEGTGVKGASFDEKKHSRTSGGQFANKLNPSELIAAKRRIEGNLANLQVGESFNLPGKVGWVKRTTGGYFVQGNGGFTASVRTLSEAISAAASLLVKKGFDK